MKSILLLTSLIFWCGLFGNFDCGDGIVYVNEKQTQYDSRFTNFPKIDGQPKLKDGTADLNKIIEAQLKVADEAKNSVFRENFIFTVTCEGKIQDIQTLGDPKMSNWTNIIEIIKGTEGMWIPALIDGKPVDCIYFGKKTVVGNKY
ncbi:hypothetical protein [Rufibacter roseus]|uniref:Uncharacterized protein n=1 Tax=Rufibacter roseus TaxID=1567108 RepID=A0ABW2DQJ8_9BACT|nr:hypothetical protein [Rufibacter roseus]